jgi:hypothetical protein
MCAAQAVFRSLSGAVTKRAALKRALFKAGLTAHNCGA